MSKDYDAAIKRGEVMENQYCGFGAATLAAGEGPVALEVALDNGGWVKSTIVEVGAIWDGKPVENFKMTDPRILVLGIIFGEERVSFGPKGVPWRAFASDSTRFGVNFGRRRMEKGEVIQILISNLTEGRVAVAAGLLWDADRIADVTAEVPSAIA